MRLSDVAATTTQRRRAVRAAALALLFRALPAAFAETLPESVLNNLRLRLLGWERGRVPDAEWRAAVAEAEQIEQRAAGDGDASAALALLEMRARALALVAGDVPGGVALLRSGRERYAPAAPVAARRVVIAEADLLARIGDAPAIRRLMDEFRAGPLYDGAPFQYTVGEGRDTPLTILRPRGGTENSITMTALSKALRRASAAPGTPFPDFTAMDSDGRPLTMADLRGRATIVVFWFSGSAEQERLLREVAAVAERRGARAPLIVAVCLDRSGEDLHSWIAREPLRRWRNIPREAAGPLMARLGIFGDSEIIVIGADGRIVGRGVGRAELPQVVDRAIAVL